LPEDGLADAGIWLNQGAMTPFSGKASKTIYFHPKSDGFSPHTREEDVNAKP
jgi:hypothetical protein